MTQKQMLFALEYVKDLNATRAYKEVYKGCKKDETASVNGSRLLGNANVKKFIDEQLEKIKSNKIADIQEVMEYLTSVLRGDSESEIVVTEFIGDGCSEARRVLKNPDEKEKIKAAELIGKRYGMFTENVNLGDLTKATSLLESINKQISGKNNG